MMTSTLWNRRVELSPEVLVQHVAGEAVVLDFTTESYFGLNEVGARLVSLIGEGAPLGEILRILLGEYEVEEATLRGDLEACLSDLIEHGLVRVVADPAHN